MLRHGQYAGICQKGGTPFENTPIPYVTSLPEFPETEKKIFRDFPDVLSDEYKENAKNKCKGH